MTNENIIALQSQHAAMLEALKGYIRLFDMMAEGLIVSSAEMASARQEMRAALAKAEARS
jgi:hypothetical protein